MSQERIHATPYGFEWYDHTGKLLMEVSRACSSRTGDRRRWVALIVKTPTETIDILAAPRKAHVNRKAKA